MRTAISQCAGRSRGVLVRMPAGTTLVIFGLAVLADRTLRMTVGAWARYGGYGPRVCLYVCPRGLSCALRTDISDIRDVSLSVRATWGAAGAHAYTSRGKMRVGRDLLEDVALAGAARRWEPTWPHARAYDSSAEVSLAGAAPLNCDRSCPASDSSSRTREDRRRLPGTIAAKTRSRIGRIPITAKKTRILSSLHGSRDALRIRRACARSADA